MSLTLSILKPDAVKRNITGKINALIQENDMQIVAQKMIKLSTAQAEQFYEVHKNRPFFQELVNMMTTGPVIAQVLSGDDAVTRYRTLMGATDPTKAEKGTIRAQFAISIGENTVHGSDSEENATREVAFFFSQLEIFS